MQLSKEQFEIFRSGLIAATATLHILPDGIETGKMYQLESFFAGSRGYEGLWFFVKQNEEGNFYLDYYSRNDDTEYHGRIDHTGAHIELENMITQWSGRIRTGNPEKDEAQRQRENKHNMEVLEILRAKGFRKD